MTSRDASKLTISDAKIVALDILKNPIGETNRDTGSINQIADHSSRQRIGNGNRKLGGVALWVRRLTQKRMSDKRGLHPHPEAFCHRRYRNEYAGEFVPHRSQQK
ncbi:MAG: hypothetical protein WCX84_00480, partial [Syntrophales bacterium]